MLRACRLSSKFATATKWHEIARPLEADRGSVNFYVSSLWQDHGALDKETLARLAPGRTRLQSMQQDQALRQHWQASPPRAGRQRRSAPTVAPTFRGPGRALP
jgi:hypothetical protein